MRFAPPVAEGENFRRGEFHETSDESLDMLIRFAALGLFNQLPEFGFGHR